MKATLFATMTLYDKKRKVAQTLAALELKWTCGICRQIDHMRKICPNKTGTSK